MQNLKKYFEYLYNSMYIPIYIYKDKKLIVAYPKKEYNVLPPSNYLDKLFSSDKPITYVETSFYSYYGSIKLAHNIDLVLGPVNDIPYSEKTLFKIKRDYPPSSISPEDFTSFFINIPSRNFINFVQILLFINYSLTHKQLSLEDVIEYDEADMETTINKNYSMGIYSDKEEGILQNNYEIESELLHYIETGNVKGVYNIMDKFTNTKVGIIAHDTLRQVKNTFVVTVTLVTRAAIRGGISPNTAYKLSDIYIKQMELLTDIDSILSLLKHMQIDFTKQVANSILPVATNQVLLKVIQYVHENTNKNITVEEIAKHIGFSRPYLSRIFKKELGFSLSDFIRRCKLEEGKSLLAFSDKSISEIASYLCFSSQSHFHKAFKDLYGLTPNDYRKSSI